MGVVRYKFFSHKCLVTGVVTLNIGPKFSLHCRQQTVHLIIMYILVRKNTNGDYTIIAGILVIV